jgi:hypothetical protein
MSSAAELQKAIFEALSANAALAALVGERILDHAPANVSFPYITFGRSTVYDWSTGTEAGSEQLFTLHVWSKAKGKREVLAMIELARATLHDQPLELETHRLVNIRVEFSEARFDEDQSVHHGVLRLRAVTEPG